jgi:hypothetical protein
MVREAFKIYEEALGITFIEVTQTDIDQGLIIVDEVDLFFMDNDTGAFAYTLAIGDTIMGSVINIAWDWDGGSVGHNSYTFETILHEIGHALGLDHLGNYNGDGDPTAGQIFINDSSQASMMSYIWPLDNPHVFALFLNLQTPMSVDWLALQILYGAQSLGGTQFGTQNAFTGDTIWGFNTNISSETSDVWNKFSIYGGGAAHTILDAGGHDTLDVSGYADDQIINLSLTDLNGFGPSASDIGGGIGNLTLAFGTVIEDAIGGSGDDIFFGNPADNIFWGNGGNDVFADSDGNDIYHGGDGTLDLVVFSGSLDEFLFEHRGDHIAVARAAGDSSVDLVYNTTEFLGFDGDEIISYADLEDLLMPNIAPSDLGLSRSTVHAGQAGAVVGWIDVLDPDDEFHTFSVSDSRFEVVNGYLKLKPGEVVILNEVEINLDITATDSDAADYTEQVTITIVDPAAGLPIYATATSGDDVFTLGSSQYTTAQGGNGDDTYIVLPTLTNNASIFDLRGTNTIVFQEGVELVAGDEEPGVYHLHLGNGATIEINNAEGQLFQIGDGPALSFTDFKAAIAGSPTVETSAAAVHGTPIDQAAVFVPATGDSGDNTFSLGHNVFVNAAGSTGNDTYIITDNQTGDARIFDLRGDNTIVLADGLQITSGAMNASFQYELTLDNGAVIAIDNAEAYDFQVGTSGPTVDFSAISARVDEGPFVVSSTSSSSATAFMYRVPLVEEQLSFEGTTTTDMPVLELIHAAEPYKEIAKPAPDQSADIQGWQDGFFPEYSIDDLYLNFA